MKRNSLFVLVAIILASCSSVLITGRKQLLLVSDAEVLSMSATAYKQFIDSVPASKDTINAFMVRKVGIKIAAAVEQYLKNNGLGADTVNYKWEYNLVKDTVQNAFCMPGGKIAFYTGILEKLKLNDDEVAMGMGHEIAHALREHARDRIAKEQMSNLGANILSQALGLGSLGSQALGQGFHLVGLSFSRADEKDADLVGMDVAARAGYDPRAGISLWQKMGASNKEKQAEWLSTHPSGEARIYEMQRNMLDALILYAKAKNTTVDRLPEYRP